MKSVDVLPDGRTTDAVNGVMKALVYHGPAQRAWEAKPKPTIRERGDAIVRITRSTICVTDLHILKGDVASVTPGRILGHEGVGVIEATDSSVSSFHTGDLVLISCITACGICDFCRRRAVPLPDRWMDPGEHHRWYPGRVRARSPCGHELVPGVARS